MEDLIDVKRMQQNCTKGKKAHLARVSLVELDENQYFCRSHLASFDYSTLGKKIQLVHAQLNGDQWQQEIARDSVKKIRVIVDSFDVSQHISK